MSRKPSRRSGFRCNGNSGWPNARKDGFRERANVVARTPNVGLPIRGTPGNSNEKTVAEAIRHAEATILAVPFSAVPEVIKSAGTLAGKVVIDATNPLGMGEDGLGLTAGFSTSGAEQIAAQAPGALVFKAFNQTGFENMADARTYASRPVMFVAGDDPGGKQTFLTLVRDAGFDAVDLGGLPQARLIEPFAMIWIELGRKRRLGPDFTFSLQPRGTPP